MKIDQLIDPLPGISLAELDERAALLRRTDTKYVLDGETLTALLGKLAPDHQALDIDGRRTFGYESVYFDTPDLLCFRDHVADRRPRFKARTRLYRDTDQCVFEVKLKLPDGEMDKRQTDHPFDAAGELTRDARECLRKAVSDVGLSSREGDLQASLRTRFTRLTLVPCTGGERATCDFAVVLERPDDGSARLREELVVFETKSERGDGPADRVLREMSIEPVSLSKYRTGIAMLAPDARDPDNDVASRRFFAVTG